MEHYSLCEQIIDSNESLLNIRFKQIQGALQILKTQMTTSVKDRSILGEFIEKDQQYAQRVSWKMDLTFKNNTQYVLSKFIFIDSNP